MNDTQGLSNIVLKTVSVVKATLQPAKWTSCLLNQSMWSLSSDRKSDIGLTGHLNDVIELVVEVSPHVFKNAKPGI
jgi:hypothetical protein